MFNLSSNEAFYIRFDEFLSYYEYVSFLYDDDADFVQVAKSVWGLI